MKSITLIFFFGALFAGCSEDPSAVGINLYPKNEKYSAHDTSIAAIGDTTFRVATANGKGYNVLVGKYSTVETQALIQFSGTIPETLATVQIDTAELKLTVNYTWNPSAAPAEFEIQKVTTPWSGATVTFDSLLLGKLTLVSTNPLTLISTSKDTIAIGKELTVQLNDSLVRDWIKISADTSKSKFYSIAIMPKSGSGIWGFSQFGTATPPRLKIKYHKNAKRDSIELFSGEDTFLARRTSSQPLDSLETQAGVSVRSKVKFNLKSISDSVNKAIVNSATMELTLKNSELGAGTADSVLALVGGSDASPDSVTLSYYAYGYRKDKNQPVYTFPVTSIVQQWVNSPSTNHGIVLRSATDASSVDKLVFHSSKDAAKGPKLFITYTKK